MKQLLFLKLTLHMCQFITFVYIMLLDYSLHCAKSSLSLVFIRTFSVSCAPLSMLGGPGRTGCAADLCDCVKECVSRIIYLIIYYGMDTLLEWKIVVGRRRFTSGHRTVGEEEEDRNYHGGTR